MMAGLLEGHECETCIAQGYEDSRFEVRDPISPSFHCPICMNVLNDPVMCRNNQHYFCRGCITEHLKNTKNCPTCQDELSLERLVKASRIVIEYLSELRIRCDFFSRGCREVVQLSDLQQHVSVCGFAAVKCSNEGCDVVVNRQDKLHHEAEVCEFRRLQCHDCVELKKEVINIREKLGEKMTEDNTKLQKQVDELSEKIGRMCEMQAQMMTLLQHLHQTIAGQPLARRSIIIAGGDGKNGNSNNSVEIFNWSQKTWTLQNAMSTRRSRASAVIYKEQIIISGGEDGNKPTNTMETSSCDEPLQWKISAAKLPELCRGHAAVIYKDCLILSGGGTDSDNISNKIYVVSMVPPYSSKTLTTMPEPRCDHTMELFENKLFIFGGYHRKAKDSVMMYDLITKKWKMMPPLPSAVDEMASVLWQNSVVIFGGRNYSDGRDTALIYNLTSGERRYLPSMKHKRRGCTAVVTGDVLVVMGGYNSEREFLKSVEAFSFEHQVWEELPDMNQARGYARAVVFTTPPN